MNKNIKIEIAVGIVLIIAVTLLIFLWITEKSNLNNDIIQPRACTKEAKICPDGSAVGRTGPNCEFAACPGKDVTDESIFVNAPIVGAEISSPVAISGRARGTWFFEGSFPGEVYDSSDKLLGSGIINFVPKNASDTWMTEDFVDFKGSISFTQAATDAGYVLFKKDNPSGNRALDKTFKVAIKFKLAAAVDTWKNYTNNQYGFVLTFPDTWKGYVTKQRILDWGSDGTSDSIDFGFAAQDGLFNISFHTQKQYDALSSSGAPFGMKLGENKGFVIVWDQAQYAEYSLKARYAEISGIIKTFKLVK